MNVGRTISSVLTEPYEWLEWHNPPSLAARFTSVHGATTGRIELQISSSSCEAFTALRQPASIRSAARSFAGRERNDALFEGWQLCCLAGWFLPLFCGRKSSHLLSCPGAAWNPPGKCLQIVRGNENS